MKDGVKMICLTFYIHLNSFIPLNQFYLLRLVTEQRQAPLDGLAGLAEASVQERLILGDFQHRDLGLTDK